MSNHTEQAKLWRTTARQLCGTAFSKHPSISKKCLYTRCRELLADSYNPALEHVYRTAITKASRNHAAWIRTQIGTGKEHYIIVVGPAIERRTIISRTAGLTREGYTVWSGPYLSDRHYLKRVFENYAAAVWGLIDDRKALIEAAQKKVIAAMQRGAYTEALTTITHMMELQNQIKYWQMRVQFPEDAYHL